MRRHSVIALVVALLVILQALVPGAAPATAVSQPAGRLVSDNPANFTPHALDGYVYSIVQVGNTMIVGGTFTQARNNSSTTVLTRNRLMAFDATTGVISTTFNPNSNGTINVVLPTGDGQTVYVGGSFTTIAGQTVKNLARIRVSDGARVSTFNGGSPAGVVKDLRLVNGRLWVSGNFTHIAGKAQKGLATLNPTTGAFDTYFTAVLAGTHTADGYLGVAKIDVDPASARLAAVGNFDTVNGVKNHQLFLLDITGATATLANFQTAFFERPCSSKWDSYMRDVDFSPDGTYFVVTTTGGYGGYGDLIPCDTASRFDLSDTGTGRLPAWVDYTGGDTSYAVEITDTAVYVGGHQRYWNNPYGANVAAAGAVSRPGIVALNPLNGLPFSWNPTRTRGVGVFDLLATGQGLWVVSDTDRIGAYEYHGRIALMPAAGAAVPAYSTAPLPNEVYSAGSAGLSKRSFTGTTAGAPVALPGGGTTWDNARGAFMVNGYLYTAFSDGSFSRRSYDGATFGTVEPVNTQDQIVVLQNWRNDAATATGMFFDSGRLYYTLAGSTSLYYRYVNFESGVVGALRKTASASVTGISFSGVKGMFLGGTKLYWATSDGNLRSIGWANSAQTGYPVAGTAAVVSGPGVDGNTWGGRAMFLFQDRDGRGAAQPLAAAFTVSCVGRTCSVDGSGSTSGGSTITAWAWAWGDGAQSAGVTSSHTYAATGEYPVTLTITTADSRTASVTRTASVVQANADPVAAATSSCSQLTCTFDASASADPDGSIVGYQWDFGDGTTATGQTPAAHTFAGAGSYAVVLTVTDNGGATDSTTVTVVVGSASVAYVAAASANGNRTSHSVTVPSAVRAGDRLVLFLTLNTTVTFTAPSGWTAVRSTDASGFVGRVWTKVATATDAGSTLVIGLSAIAKGDLTVAAYRSNTASVVVADSAANTVGVSATITTPTLAVGPGGLVVDYLAAKSSSTTTVVLPGDLTVRSSSAGTGGGAIFAWTTDSGNYLSGGSFGGGTVTLSAAASRSVVYALLLRAG